MGDGARLPCFGSERLTVTYIPPIVTHITSTSTNTLLNPLIFPHSIECRSIFYERFAAGLPS